MNRLRLPAILMFSLLLASAAGCGYRLSGRGGLPGDIQSLHVPVVQNKSSETGAEVWVTHALIRELNRRQQGLVVDAGDAEATLTGVIESITWDTVTRRGLNTAAERRVYATLSLTLTAADGQVLWERSRLQAEQAYDVVDGNKPATENNRRAAIQELADRLAETVYRRMTDQF